MITVPTIETLYTPYLGSGIASRNEVYGPTASPGEGAGSALLHRLPRVRARRDAMLDHLDLAVNKTTPHMCIYIYIHTYICVYISL